VLLVVITGPPASGKTTLARALAGRLRVTVLSKDTFKETLYEVFGSEDEIEDRIDAAGVRLLAAAAEDQLDSGLPVIVESNFDPDSDTELVGHLQRGHRARLAQIYCDLPDQDIVESFRERAQSNRRHPGHRDEPEDAADVERGLAEGEWQPLDLDAPLLRIHPDEVTRILEWLDAT
jgi:predicted kinase